MAEEARRLKGTGQALFTTAALMLDRKRLRFSIVGPEVAGEGKDVGGMGFRRARCGAGGALLWLPGVRLFAGGNADAWDIAHPIPTWYTVLS
jgi:hypothetical protein